jgi:hypothetical protein
VQVFPNPVQDKFQVNGIDKINYPLKVEVFSQEGKLVRYDSINEIDATISMSDLAGAIYQVRITDKNGDLFIVQLLKE